MAEDKRIRVSADLSQLRSLREEVTMLNRDMIDLTNEQNRLSNIALSQLREQLKLLRDRNDFEALFYELKKKNNDLISTDSTNQIVKPQEQQQQSQETTENREYSQPRESKENIENVERNVQNIQERVTNSTREINEEKTNKETLVENLKENVVNIERNTQNIKENITSSIIDRKEEKANPNTRVENDNVERISEPRRDRIEETIRNDSSNERPLGSILARSIEGLSTKTITAFDFQNNIIRSLIQKVQISNRALNGLVDIVSSIDETLYNRYTDTKDEVSNPIVPTVPIVPPVEPERPIENTEPRPRREEDNTERRRENAPFNPVARIISSAGGAAVQNPVAAVGSTLSGLTGIIGESLNAIPVAGPILGGIVTALGNAAAGIIVATAEKAMEAQKRAVNYSQVMGISNDEAMGVAGREGSYAASSLGINIGQYIERRGDLIRSAGGKEQSVAPVAETQSLMAAERLYGLNPESINKLIGTVRFSSEEGTQSSSSVIRIFERTMRELKLPFSEIAATMDESLSTFTKSADEILSKTGEFDASKLAATLAGVRAFTNMEGRQLERVQSAITGEGISQDEVTQAYLLRSLTKLMPTINSYSEAMAAIERIGETPELMESFIKDLQQNTQTNEQFINVLQSAFPKLSFNDIRDLVKDGRDLSPMFDKIEQLYKDFSRENEAKNRYDKDAAAQTVSTGEKIMSEYENGMIEWGKDSLEVIRAIYEKLEEFLKKANEIKQGNIDWEAIKDFITNNNPAQLATNNPIGKALSTTMGITPLIGSLLGGEVLIRKLISIIEEKFD